MIGKTLGSYEILSPLGKGGMGEVWRARDSKLGREVAIKTLPEEFAKDEERLTRFEREAKLLASLNHPNIAAIYGLEEDNGTRFLVPELVEGDTLADRLKRGAIPVAESLKLALQIAEALEAAHEKGVIHRDLKPANIKVTPDGKVKVLDFGLAKALAGDGSDVNLSQSPTLSMTATQQGVILGSAAYMAPEQARGQEVDKRADVWAFGCVLYEMLTGRQTWAGPTVTDMIAAAVAKDADFTILPVNINPRIQELLRRCLEKEPKNRWQAVGDVRVEVEQVLGDPDGLVVQPVADVVQAPPRPVLRWVGATFLVTAIVAAIATWNLKPHPPMSVVRFTHLLPDEQVFTAADQKLVGVAPDGSSIVYVANGQLWIRDVGSEEARPVSGTQEYPGNPIFSPDGQWIAYRAGNQLKKVEIAGGTPVPLYDGTDLRGWDWVDDTVYFGQPGMIMSVSANGGTPEVVVDNGTGPHMLPGGAVLLFNRQSGGASSGAQIWAYELETGEETLLIEDGQAPSYASTGHLIYYLNQTIFAAPFDAANLTVTGGPVPLIESVSRIPASPVPHFGLSDNGTVVYVKGGVSTIANRILALVDRNGDVEPLNVPPAQYSTPRISPDGTQLAVQTTEDDGQSIVWVYDLSGNSAIRRLTQEGNNSRPIWTPGGERLTFASDRDGTTSIWWQPADGSGVAERLTTAEEGTRHLPESWSPDGNVLSFAVRRRRDYGIWTLSLDGGATPELFYDQPESVEVGSLFSPDGKWLAYYSSEGGPARQVFVQAFPATGSKHQITQAGGLFPVWSPDGNELFYRRETGTGETPRITGVDVSTDGGFRFGIEQTLPIQGPSYLAPIGTTTSRRAANS